MVSTPRNRIHQSVVVTAQICSSFLWQLSACMKMYRRAPAGNTTKRYLVGGVPYGATAAMDFLPAPVSELLP
ncbi:hypothetical protein C362_03618 [Cryptococcus neoformans Bt1]|nr:hypothetical protein C362_03618 [Cryptococcus neoformans var. grubii Bt1]OXB36359.1 hypothetical protein J007_03917 [Cryptococcus neoformans var. grubii]OXC60567.1 hypothetical protein C358_04014 [Cryptococcus neoformans var. grubii MW-RSA852]OXC69615.1 hypothetical protein AYX13_01783 [Cryptococcus neoformans var. grubii]OXG22945.1 hypothetical protein C367_03872 [Cryptococcus neoformans var. grubii Ze90-1]